MKAKIREIYPTTLTKLLLDNGSEIVKETAEKIERSCDVDKMKAR